MDLRAAFETHAQPIAKGPRCSVGKLLADLSPDDTTFLRSVLADPHWLSSAISRALDDYGYRIGDYTIQRHRSGRCLCVDDDAR